MLRFVAFAVVCFLLPFAIYALWRRFGPSGRIDADHWTYPVLIRLSAAGIVLTLAAVLALVSFSGGRVGTTYHPAAIHDGKLTPGGFD